MTATVTPALFFVLFFHLNDVCANPISMPFVKKMGNMSPTC